MVQGLVVIKDQIQGKWLWVKNNGDYEITEGARDQPTGVLQTDESNQLTEFSNRVLNPIIDK